MLTYITIIIVIMHAIIIVETLHVVTFMFDGVVVAEPFLLYHDEISVGTSATSGVLTCRVESSYPVWRDVGPTNLISSSPYRSTYLTSRIRRLSRTGVAPIPNDTQHNGLWSCIEQDRRIYGFIGIYNRGEGITYVITHFSRYK